MMTWWIPPMAPKWDQLDLFTISPLKALAMVTFDLLQALDGRLMILLADRQVVALMSIMVNYYTLLIGPSSSSHCQLMPINGGYSSVNEHLILGIYQLWSDEMISITGNFFCVACYCPTQNSTYFTFCPGFTSVWTEHDDAFSIQSIHLEDQTFLSYFTIWSVALSHFNLGLSVEPLLLLGDFCYTYDQY